MLIFAIIVIMYTKYQKWIEIVAPCLCYSCVILENIIEFLPEIFLLLFSDSMGFLFWDTNIYGILREGKEKDH